ncbi:pfkB family carbohydrate kinase (Mak32) [Aspergillus rambellii]|uniref:PfkB family carbohydrate kinase (Mak32) n=3 Tax=Aspergillus subgen. Nidulantes TaxID=2720870 RepID=A0A0F8VBY8_9EURO|nr:pfkB family carbohydrate kinase (Mak32) [Aspergillus rambellii]
MFILDDIDFEGTQPSVKNVLGGAASFAVVGARLVAGREYSQSVSWIVDVGSDFPPEIIEVLKAWNTDTMFREDFGRLTTRAWNGYGPNEKRDFRYLTPKLRLEPYMLSESQIFSKTIHMVCSSSRCASIVQDILRRQEVFKKEGKGPSSRSKHRTIFVWEPVPDMCSPEEQEKFFAACKMVDVVSPNDLELGMMFGQPPWVEGERHGKEIVDKILSSGIGPEGNGHLVIRAGKDGSYTFSRNERIWMPAYHQPSGSGHSPVVDPTGAGNSFLGALTQGMVSEGRDPAKVINSVLAGSTGWQKAMADWEPYQNVLVALIFATVAASFVVEQIGVPRLSTSTDGKELWNGTEFTERVRLYTQRLYRTLEESPQKHYQIN